MASALPFRPTPAHPSKPIIHLVDPALSEPQPSSTLGLSSWANLVEHINKYFYDADIAALEIALSACVSHFHKGADPAWLFMLGPSGGDKTSILVNCCLALEQSYLLGDITPKTFLSGYTGAPNASLLHKIGSGILVFKDFTTFLSKRQEEQGEIASQLREIYDGYWKRNTGKGQELEWHGKITTIAAATPALERKWSTLGDLGERFLQVRLARKNGIKQAECAQRQSGLEEFITNKMRELAKTLLRSSPPITYPPPLPSEPQRYKIACIAEIIAHSRGKVPRDAKTGHIIGLAEIENSGRPGKELSSLVSGHAALFRRDAIDDKLDMWIAKRVGKNSIPVNRYIVLNSIWQYNVANNSSISLTELVTLSKFPASTLRYHLDELSSLGMVDAIDNGIENTYRLSDAISELWKSAFT